MCHLAWQMQKEEKKRQLQQCSSSKAITQSIKNTFGSQNRETSAHSFNSKPQRFGVSQPKSSEEQKSQVSTEEQFMMPFFPRNYFDKTDQDE